VSSNSATLKSSLAKEREDGGRFVGVHDRHGAARAADAQVAGRREAARGFEWIDAEQ